MIKYGIGLWLAVVGLVPAWGQFVTTSGTSAYGSPYDFEYRAEGTLIARGQISAGSYLADHGAGVRMLWYANLGAFRAGYVNGDQWDYTSAVQNIGLYSAAFGYGTKASNSYTTASGKNSVASGIASTAIGYLVMATGDYATAFGNLNSATGSYSMAFGYGNVASGLYSTTFGHNTTSEGYYGTAFGFMTDAYAHDETIFGRYNQGASLCQHTETTTDGQGNTIPAPTSSQFNWYAGDPLLEVGNGTSSAPSDALVVYKNGNAVFQGTVGIAAGGDIPMYSGQ